MPVAISADGKALLKPNRQAQAEIRELPAAEPRALNRQPK